RVGGARQDGPGLGYGVDPAFLAVLGAEPGAVVEGRAAIPFTVPRVRLKRLAHRGRVGPPAFDTAWVATFRQWREQLDGAREQPAEPDALALAAFADAVHAVVPVARAHKGQAKRAREFEALVEAAGAVFEQRGGFGRLRGMKEGVVLAWSKRWTLEKRDGLLQNGAITRGIHVGRRRECQPDAVVRNPRADALP